MFTIGIFDDSEYVRDTWYRYVEELGHKPVAPLAKSSVDFLSDVKVLMGQPEFKFDGVILDMQFKDGERAGKQLWQQLVEQYGEERLGALLVATKFASDDVAAFAESVDAAICTAATRSFRQAALDTLVEMIARRKDGEAA